MGRKDGRRSDELRRIEIIKDYVEYPEGSVLISAGGTRVLCNVSIEERTPAWCAGSHGWVTAEYSLLPRSTHARTPRETTGPGARTQEIRRLIGRSLRAAVHLEKLGQRTCTVDCDVLQADGGTRTASITGGYVALRLALTRLCARGDVPPDVFAAPVAAVSLGVVGGEALLDLCYEEDVRAEVDANIVMTGGGEFIEVQATAEKKPLAPAALHGLLGLAAQGIRQLLEIQARARRS